ncbi:bifunctional phosphopantothenoylcysteine decarboxylase/phosphopantothenate--cysteine ligase CoaBC [Kocuria palustris]|jgi:phosphopantothenoylcysteine decarboxylase/phosphopantothenate--cysteine ligase|uniref:bifunctional phosphopantothenoylcysteine decarboxylase/phosphopantothenate--cysteine ligase CoaBC n=1 Tax=Kocuria palustris TaxID=71999 RepID=UPI0019D0BB24|nr:bifunctional phosphopantothenoylcysteine decarboxylase/phosphopantothenate--cysteine ligase CoaBC [Kocuria palustris]MBN6752451.1 bifunctional phosphopantothenoylcysteine decarboxylase/phosphopantothenate--cysteine ligase CoaBC [Kocuria palustris]MBN6757406.1 bifunctional phosphopantothenoylcysteine decarboxylase/phosphopantothenate--cysteine ligase CoaBC [Kocuria palustris]MBN6762434.1 bifunctional phosphopantothenoylcysteine decarboxylase/phosphopantothenate--cysteine ligase CoaBC [Kocuria 
MRIVLGIGGGIAAYKSALLLRLLTEAGHHVVPMPTRAALEFVGAPTWEALSGEPVSTDVFDRVDTVNHVRQGQAADLVIVAPATADLLARAAHGLADDLLTTTLLATEAPVLLAPAMHTQMWENPAVRENVAALRRQGRHVLEPASGRLTGQDTGPGRLPDPEAIRDAALALVAEPARTPTRPSLSGLRAVVSTGGTQEPLDPVRFLGNRSSGKQGLAVARALQAAGAQVDLVAGHTEVALPEDAEGLSVHRVSTALELQEAMQRLSREADVVVMAAAVADFRPAEIAESKIKKTDDDNDAPTIVLTRNPDILRGLVQARDDSGREQLIVGFAAETGDAQTDPLEFGRAKLVRKGCDLLCVNQVGTDLVFGQDTTRVTILEAPVQGRAAPDETVDGTKAEVAAALARRIAQRVGRAD